MSNIRVAREKYMKGSPLNKKRITMKQVNAAIALKFPKVFLVKGEGYFYIASDDTEMGKKIAGMKIQSIYVYRLNEQTIEQWVADVAELMAETRNH